MTVVYIGEGRRCNIELKFHIITALVVRLQTVLLPRFKSEKTARYCTTADVNHPQPHAGRPSHDLNRRSRLPWRMSHFCVSIVDDWVSQSCAQRLSI
jgi:hypothetical protein